MKTVILAGGFGSRISEESHLRPKPMIEIGGRPILWHIMKAYAHHGFSDFVVCAGYKQDIIKEYFSDFFLHHSDVTFDYRGGTLDMEVHNTTVEPWRVTVADTGLFTNTAGRVLRARRYVGNERFMLTYGDGLSNVDPHEVIQTHIAAEATVTLTGVVIGQRFGVLDIDANGRIRTFREKRDEDGAFVNGGFMVCEPTVFDAIERAGKNPDDEDFSRVSLEWLAKRGELACHRHEGFWACMDTQRDRERLEQMWACGDAPWKVWDK